jgi:uroporphyrinogen decarboxylase
MSKLSSRQRVRLALEHQETDRVPIAMVCSGINPPAYADLENYLHRERATCVKDYLKGLIDIKDVAPTYCGPQLKSGEDFWGVVRHAVSYGAGSYDEISHYPLAGVKNPGDLKNQHFPCTQWFDYTALDTHIRMMQSTGDYCLMISNGNIFETTWYMRGFEQTFIDLVENPELFHAIMEQVTQFNIDHFTRMLEVADGRVDLAFTADDIGGQRGLLVSLPMWEKAIKPYHVRLNKAIHQFGVRVIYHSDGAVMKAVDGLMDMGIDVLQALQFSAEGMDPLKLKQTYGKRLCFEGGISVQTTLPFGTPEDVQREVIERITVLGKEGGYILGPSHAIQAGTPPENILAMFDCASNFKWTPA